MRMNIFVENQPVRSPLVWILVAPLMTCVCVALASLEHLSAGGAFAVSIISLLSLTMSVTLTSLTLSVVVTDKDVRVRLFPFGFIGTRIEHSDIDSAQVQVLKNYSELGRTRMKPLEKTFQMFVLDGDDLVRIRSREGRDILIGTLDPVSLSKAVNAIRIRTERDQMILAE